MTNAYLPQLSQLGLPWLSRDWPLKVCEAGRVPEAFGEWVAVDLQLRDLRTQAKQIQWVPEAFGQRVAVDLQLRDLQTQANKHNESLKPLANGLLSIYSFVICGHKQNKYNESLKPLATACCRSTASWSANTKCKHRSCKHVQLRVTNIFVICKHMQTNTTSEKIN